MKICMVGTGYVGLVTGACLADFGIHVTCVDKVKAKIDLLNRGGIPIYEPGLDLLVSKNAKAGRLRFTTDLKSAIRESQVIFIAVGTPQGDDGAADTSAVFAVARTIAREINGFKVIVNKSTVPIGTAREVTAAIRAINPKADFAVVSNPEFLREGSAIQDFMQPDRVVIGVGDPRAEAIMKEVYKPLYHLETPVLITNVESSELIKYASNAFLATKISFINEIAVLCEKVGGDVLDVARGMGLDARIGPRFLQPGPGYGGSCFPKDTMALLDIARKQKYHFAILESVVDVNWKIKERMVRKVRRAAGPLKGKTVAVLGLAFKPETDDIRESPALPLLEALLEAKAKVQAYDPEAMPNTKALFRKVRYVRGPYAAAKGADVLVIVTEWNEFRYLDLGRIKKLMNRPVLVDLRNVYAIPKVREAGFEYHPVGRIRERW
jgi:UDPglucose 6-dehydrogenase